MSSPYEDMYDFIYPTMTAPPDGGHGGISNTSGESSSGFIRLSQIRA